MCLPAENRNSSSAQSDCQPIPYGSSIHPLRILALSSIIRQRSISSIFGSPSSVCRFRSLAKATKCSVPILAGDLRLFRNFLVALPLGL